MHLSFRHITFAAALFFATITVHAKSASEIYEQAARSTVVVENIDSKSKVKSMGSGVVLPDGGVVTNCHVVKGASSLKVRSSGKEHIAVLRYSDWDRDVCSLNVAGLNAQAVVVGNTKTLKVGAKVYAIGAPKGLELTLSDGIVSSLREVEGGRYIQTTAAISPGSSGGGLFDENGALVGLTTFYLAEGQNLNFAVPVEWVKDLLHRSAQSRYTRIPLDDDTVPAPSKGKTKRPPPNHQPVTQWLNKAIELQSRKDWPALRDHSRRWTISQPSSAMAWYSLGIAYDEAGLSSKAIDIFQRALRINPEDGKAWYSMGIAYGKAGQYTNAIEAYQQALRINSEDAGAWRNLGNAYDNAGQPHKAIEAYQQALSIDPELAIAWNNLGDVYFGSGQFTKAIDAHQHALRINPEDAKTWARLGVAYALSGQRGKVLEVYKRLKTLDPVLAEGFFNKIVNP